MCHALQIGSRPPIYVPKIATSISPLQPAPIASVLCDLHTRMQVFQPSGIMSYIQFEGEMTISLALEFTKKATS